MVDKDNMSVEEMVAYCQRVDGEGGGAPAETPAAAPAEPAPAAESPAAEAAAAPSKPAAEMSIEEMMAAARGEKSGDAAPATKADAPKAKKPAAKPASAEDAREMSVEEMMAAARGEAAGGGDAAEEEEEEAAPAAAGGGDLDPKAAREMSMEEMLAAARGGGGGAKPAAKPKAKPAKKAAKAAPAAKGKPESSAPTGPKDTGSIFAERNPTKPGPLSKAEAAAQTDGKKKPAKAEKPMPVMPERPAYVSPAPPQEADGSNRRGFFAAASGMVLGSSMAIGFASLAVTNLLWTLGLAKFMFPNILIEPPTKFKVGFPTEYAPGQVQTKYKAQFGVWVVRYEYEGAAQIYAIKSVCTHLGCTPNWLEGEQKFKCPCHGSGFYKDGINFEGPAPRPLERYAIRIADDGQLEVDKSQTFNEEKGQWADGASFVTA